MALTVLSSWSLIKSLGDSKLIELLKLLYIDPKCSDAHAEGLRCRGLISVMEVERLAHGFDLDLLESVAGLVD